MHHHAPPDTSRSQQQPVLFRSPIAAARKSDHFRAPDSQRDPAICGGRVLTKRMQSSVIYTVGHSTRSLDELVALLARAGVRQLVDVRSVPGSRRHPHFAGEALARSLPDQEIAYRHEPRLGGVRRPPPDSPNPRWGPPAVWGLPPHPAGGAVGTALAPPATHRPESS